jgi:hypothetical protein
MKNKQCIVCGLHFVAPHPATKTCSEICWKKHNKQIRNATTRKFYKKKKEEYNSIGLAYRPRKHDVANCKSYYENNREEKLIKSRQHHRVITACYRLLLEREGDKEKLIQLLKENELI